MHDDLGHATHPVKERHGSPVAMDRGERVLQK
jgi:hypothetical protein